MKKVMKLYTPAACAVLAVLTLIKVLLPLFGLSVTYRTPVMSVFLFAVAAVGAVSSAVLCKLRDPAGICAAILLPLTILFGIVLFFDAEGGFGWWLPLASAAVSAAAFAFAKARFSAKALCGVLALLLSFPLFSFTVLNMIFGDVGTRTVLAHAEQPYSHMSAELIEIDTGALGVDYHIEVWENGADTDLGFAKITKERQSVPVRDYYITEIQMEFKDKDTVVINGDEYNVG